LGGIRTAEDYLSALRRGIRDELGESVVAEYSRLPNPRIDISLHVYTASILSYRVRGESEWSGEPDWGWSVHGTIEWGDTWQLTIIPCHDYYLVDGRPCTRIWDLFQAIEAAHPEAVDNVQLYSASEWLMVMFTLAEEQGREAKAAG
jgi:hypothetical protein